MRQMHQRVRAQLLDHLDRSRKVRVESTGRREMLRANPRRHDTARYTIRQSCQMPIEQSRT